MGSFSLRSIVVIALVLISHFHGVLGQDIHFRGIVLEKETKEVLPFVTIRLEGTPLGSIAEDDGAFRIKIPTLSAKGTLVFSCQGYETLMKPISELFRDSLNTILLDVRITQLKDVIVLDEKKLKPQNLLKEIIANIPLNYQTRPIVFDAHYRELITENGVAIKLTDAATTIRQKGYTGKNSKSKSAYRHFLPLENEQDGIMLGGIDRFIENVYAMDRLHDHFGHIPTTENRVWVHESRKTLNQTREGMYANIEGGPLSTLAKDLVMDLDLFLRKSMFNKYNYELFEMPASQNEWDYLIKFTPRKPPETLESIQSKVFRNKNIHRVNILSGSIIVDQKTLAIKSIKYRVENNYRRHICGYQVQSLKHYGYEVELDYQKVDDRWQVDRILRKDEFILKDTVKQVNSSFVAIAQLQVVNPLSALEDVPMKNSFVDVWSNSLYEYPQPYNAKFWEAYEKKYPSAKISDGLRRELEDKKDLEDQFEIKSRDNTP